MSEEREARRRGVTRRRFLTLAGAAALLGACRAATPTAPPPATTAAPPAAPATSATPARTPSGTPAATATPAPAGAATAAPTASPPLLTRVAVERSASYDLALLRQQVRALLDGLGGLQGVVGAGSRVAIKVNLTGGSYFAPPAGLSATESYMTHPAVVQALGELLRDAGARELCIVEAIFDGDSYRRYGYEPVAQALGATLVDLNSPAPYADFATVPVGAGAFIYEQLTLNRLLGEVDAFVSVAKMKAHCRCGVTLAMKNLVGLVPVTHYRLRDGEWSRSALHGATNEETRTRLPRAVVDINRARPIDLALIDGIMTSEGGEVPRSSFAPLPAGVIVAAKDPVAADAVATAVMGFDPAASYPDVPFVNADNHLELARDAGLGTNRLEEIEVVGEPVAAVRCQFKPCWSE